MDNFAEKDPEKMQEANIEKPEAATKQIETSEKEQAMAQLDVFQSNNTLAFPGPQTQAPLSMPGFFQWQRAQTGIKQVPVPVMQKNVFGLFSSRELFRIRGVCSDWSDTVKGIWCQVVKDEMLEQVHSLDLLYEKETTAKLLEFKLKYLVSYATLMNNYFSHMNFNDIVAELISLDDSRARQLMLIAAMVVGPQEHTYPSKFENISEDDLLFAQEYLISAGFAEKFQAICTMDSIPEVSLQQMKVIKTEMMDKVITPTLADELGNAARLLSSWLDGILEFTILKHEVIVLRMKNNKVLEKIRGISRLWPKKKIFIEGAYKILLFTKNKRRQISYTMKLLRNQSEQPESQVSYAFMNYDEAQNRVVKKWYQMRIDEETQKNQRLRDLHENLTRLKLLKQQQQMGASTTTQEIVSGQQTSMDMQTTAAQVSQPQQDGSNAVPETLNQDFPMSTLPEDQEQSRQAVSSEIETLQRQIAEKQHEIEESQQIGAQSQSINQESQRQASAFETQLHQRWQHVEDRIHMREGSNVEDPAASEELKVVQPELGQAQSAVGASQMQNAAMFQSQLLTQMLQVGSLFSQRAQLEDEQAQQKEQMQRLLNERERNRRLKRKMREAQRKQDPEAVITSSDSEEVEELDPEMKQLIQFEEHLKKRIFLADRIEKVEKALVQMNLMAKDVLFCSDFEFSRFKQALSSPEVLQQISSLIQTDQEDVWFDLYRTITSSKDLAEKQVERQIVRQQRQQQRRLKRKKVRLQAIKQAFLRSEISVAQAVQKCQTKEQKRQVRRERAGSAPSHLNHNREVMVQRRILEQTEQLQKAQQQHQQAQGALDELSNIVVSLAAVRYLLDQVETTGGEQANNEQRAANDQQALPEPESSEHQPPNAQAAQQVAMMLLQAAQRESSVLESNLQDVADGGTQTEPVMQDSSMQTESAEPERHNESQPEPEEDKQE